MKLALVAHDGKKAAMVTWARQQQAKLAPHQLVATGTTGARVAEATGLTVERVLSGPLGGDQQLGARIAEGQIDLLIFFVDPLEPQPHDVDVKALIRIAALRNVPMALNESTATLLIGALS